MSKAVSSAAKSRDAKSGDAKSLAPFVSEKLIRFHHCDPAGIVFYPQYFILFHELLEDWFNRGLGVDYADFVSKERRGLPTAHIDCDFKVPSKIGDTVEMQLAVKRIGRTSLALSVRVCARHEVRVTANQVLVLISLLDGALVPIPALRGPVRAVCRGASL